MPIKMAKKCYLKISPFFDVPLNMVLNKAKGILGCTADKRCEYSTDTEQDSLTRIPWSCNTAIWIKH